VAKPGVRGRLWVLVVLRTRVGYRGVREAILHDAADVTLKRNGFGASPYERIGVMPSQYPKEQRNRAVRMVVNYLAARRPGSRLLLL